MGIILAILVFGLIVTIHELGHFLLAKKNGIHVEEFSIGMGPRLFSKSSRRYKVFDQTASNRRLLYDGRR